MDNLISSLWTPLWTIVNVIILFLLLKKFLFKPVNNVIEKRQEMIQNNLDSAAASKKEAEELKNKYEEAMSSARAEAKEIISSANSQAKQQFVKSKDEAAAEIERMKISAKKEIEHEQKTALESTHNQIAELALEMASKVMQKNMSEDENSRFIEEFLSGEASE